MRRATHRAVRNNHKALAMLAAAGGLALATQWAGAQTWVNPNSGSWSVGANWVGSTPPVSAATTVLQFNATGSQTYTAFNNIANPFTLNAMNFNNTSTGAINIAAPELDLGATLITLPSSLLSAETQLRERCTAQLRGDFSSFITLGRGGTETAPDDLQISF